MNYSNQDNIGNPVYANKAAPRRPYCKPRIYDSSATDPTVTVNVMFSISSVTV